MPPLWDEEGTVPPVLDNKKHPSLTGRRKKFHVINTSRQRLFWACEKERGEMGTDFRHLQSPQEKINSGHNYVWDNNWGPPSLSLYFQTACCLLQSCHNSASYQYIKRLIWQPNHRFAVGMWGSGQENCLFMIQQRLWTRTDAVANWKMNENWQVSQGNQSDRIGFQYGNAGEMITWKLLQHISDFSFLRDNGLVCPLGLTRCSASKGKSTKSRMKVPAPEIFINMVVKGLKRLFSQPPF